MSMCVACKGNFEVTKDHTIDLDTREEYDDDDPCILRIKFTSLSLCANLLTFPPMLIYRVFDLISLNFIKRGKEKALHHFLVQMKSDESLKGRAVALKEVAIESLKELAISITKIVLLPLGMVAKEFICLFGLIFPFQGRKYFGKVDKFFYVRPLDMFKTQYSLLLFANFSAPCMQTSQFRKQENLFRFYETIRSDISYHLELTKLIADTQEYYPLDLSELNPAIFNYSFSKSQEAIRLLKELISNYKKTHLADPGDVQKIVDQLKQSA
jgi:hypothetical protein